VLLLALPAGSSAAERRDRPSGGKQPREHAFFEVRAPVAAYPKAPNAAQAALQGALGVQGVVDVDAVTGTPRVVAKLDGFLTGRSVRDAKEIALDYVRAHPAVFKLDADDLAGLRLVRDYTDVGGTRHLVWAQLSRGIPAFDNDLRASVTHDGRLVNILGSPLPDLEASAGRPVVDASHALGAALRNVGRDASRVRVLSRGDGPRQATRFAGGHRAGLVLFNDGHGVRLAWHVTANADTDEVYNSVVDAASGAVLRRSNKVEAVDALAWDNYPGAANGGTQSSRDITAWLTPGTTILAGPNAHVFSDVNDNDFAAASEEVSASGGNWNYPFTAFSEPAGFCAPNPGFFSTCSWDSYTNDSWTTNREQNATQAFYFINNFHDHLAAAPIGFTAAAGAFEGTDRLNAHTDDGANVGSGLGPNMPDGYHLNNANMLTPPDGYAPTMQMYLFTSFTGVYDQDPTPDVNGGDDAGIVYHEYTHGLSNRLITYSDGWGALDYHQSGSMGEAWSDWYAMDYLVEHGFQPDTATQGEVVLGAHVDNGNDLVRSEGLDCAVGASAALCPGTSTAGSGGYTLRDLGKVFPGGPEVHADGEIWAQTLWQLRQRIVQEHGAADGIGHTRTLVTRAMELSPTNPSFLKMRDAILQADQVNFGGMHNAIIWEVFASRGMGYLAWTAGANSVSTVQDFSRPRTFTCLGRTATKVGTNGPDTITGSSGPDVIVGNGGNDKINGMRGNDLICGGSGADTLTGGGGADKFDGGTHNDVLYARDTTRELTIKGGTGTDRARKDRRDRTNSVERFF
jgi:extracellular elastinolytic metalloproteinase